MRYLRHSMASLSIQVIRSLLVPDSREREGARVYKAMMCLQLFSPFAKNGKHETDKGNPCGTMLRKSIEANLHRNGAYTSTCGNERMPTRPLKNLARHPLSFFGFSLTRSQLICVHRTVVWIAGVPPFGHIPQIVGYLFQTPAPGAQSRAIMEGPICNMLPLILCCAVLPDSETNDGCPPPSAEHSARMKTL